MVEKTEETEATEAIGKTEAEEAGKAGEAGETGKKSGRKSKRKADAGDSLRLGAVFWVPLSLMAGISAAMVVLVVWLELQSRHPLEEWPADRPRCDDAEVVAAVTGEPVIVERWAFVGAHVYEIRAMRVFDVTPRHVEYTDGQTRLVCDAQFYVDSADHTDEHLDDGIIEVQTLPTGETAVVWEVDGARSTARFLPARTPSALSGSVTPPSGAGSATPRRSIVGE